MKRYIISALAVIMVTALFIIGVGATDAESAVTEEVITDAVMTEDVSAEEIETEAVEGEVTVETVETEISETEGAEEAINVGEIKEIVNNSDTPSSAILMVMEKYDISFERAERLVYSVKAWGDSHLSGNELWDSLSEDIEANPQKYILIAAIFILFVILFVCVIRRMVSDMVQIRSIKMSNKRIEKAIAGDEGDADDTDNLRALISKKNAEIQQTAEELTKIKQQISEIVIAISNMKGIISESRDNTVSSLNVNKESAYQIIQLISALLDRKAPILSKEAREIWSAAAMENIKKVTTASAAKEDKDVVDSTESKI